MSVKNADQINAQISTTIISSDEQPHAFHRINIEYFSLYHDTSKEDLSKAVTQGMKLGFLNTAKQRESASQWRATYNRAFKALCDKTVADITQLHHKLPASKLRQLSGSTAEIKAQLIQVPNDYLRHFHLAWLYLLKHDLKQAELHFNISALQSQKSDPEFACFALRHLAEARYRSQQYPQALLAIKTAQGLAPEYDPELHFEYTRLLALSTRCSESLKQLNILITKAPHYDSLASVDVDFKRSPPCRHYFATRLQRHMQNILNELNVQWENDPLSLLDLDKELGTPNSLQAIKQKQVNTIKELPELLLSDETRSTQLIQHQSRQFVMNALNVRKQYFIQNLEQHQHCASRVHKAGQWLIYSGILAAMALIISHAMSTISKLLGHTLPVNGSVQAIVLIVIAVLVLIGMILLHFTPTKLNTLLKKKQQLEHISAKLGMSA
ncbi:hypothetical protein EOL70_19520 [Leucothrix sargassi]|nr:hypothetical protein EOL70_19520 [Leucothrix sargassi]